MDELLIGTLLPGAVPIDNHNINPVWRGNVQLSDVRRSMYVKAVEPRTLAVEVICAIVGRRIGLPIPRPALVQVTSRSLPQATMPTLFFGSESVDNPDLKKWLARDPDTTMAHLNNWSKLIDAGCFDEWIANADRHGGNILYGGGKNFVLIDHSEALPRRLQVADPALENTILTFASSAKPPKQIQTLYGKAKACTQPYASITVQAEIQQILHTVCDHATVDGLLAFLHQRIHSLLMLISKRIGHAQDYLVLNK